MITARTANNSYGIITPAKLEKAAGFNEPCTSKRMALTANFAANVKSTYSKRVMINK